MMIAAIITVHNARPSKARIARLANPKVRERHSPLHASRGLGTPEAPPQGEEPSPRAITMSAVGSLAAVPTVSSHSLRALKRASSKASKPVVRSGA